MYPIIAAFTVYGKHFLADKPPLLNDWLGPGDAAHPADDELEVQAMKAGGISNLWHVVFTPMRY